MSPVSIGGVVEDISADDLLSEVDDPIHFAEMFDAAIFNARSSAIEGCIAILDEEVERNRRYGSVMRGPKWLADRMRTLLAAGRPQ